MGIIAYFRIKKTRVSKEPKVPIDTRVKVLRLADPNQQIVTVEVELKPVPVQNPLLATPAEISNVTVAVGVERLCTGKDRLDELLIFQKPLIILNILINGGNGVVMDLTKEYFDRQLKTQLETQTKELKTFSREQTEELARITNAGFEDVGKKLDEIVERLDVREQVKALEEKFDKLEKALNIKL